ncbi:ATP-dependent nuclease [Alkalibacillus haloalkaliphilus]|uniref:ATP-dependent nuclease n=1 Tax=Alkalibacillus haloalkaliphilus TaxID=94136 RepID=UPI0012FDC227|nr:AAA family ATPase [Alkalibacillus haloalkaliphilus]
MIKIRITSIKVNNFKSFGEIKNALILEKDVTAIIGKNESGKSNLLEAIGLLPFLSWRKGIRDYYENNRNLINNKGIEISFKFLCDELNPNESQLVFNNTKTANISGEISEILSKNKVLAIESKRLKGFIDKKQLWNIDSKEVDKFKDVIEPLVNVGDKVLLNFDRNINFIRGKVKKEYQNSKDVYQVIDKISEILREEYKRLPRIIYLEEVQELQYEYDFQDIEDIFKARNNVFYRLLQISNITKKDLDTAFHSTNEDYKQNTREELEEKINFDALRDFNDFYTQEDIQFKARFDGQKLKFSLKSGQGKRLSITERSDGLKWYLGLFIELKSLNYFSEPSLILIDEPGVHLHVNAQKEVLKFFDDLTSKGHQIVYTTHSPFMINNDNLMSVRPVSKDYLGYTVISKNFYDQELSSDSKMETLSPLVNAIGMDLKFNIGPSSNKINIITEGISDYYYLSAMIKFLDIDEDICIIPSTGASNINRLASILIGWGYEFNIVLDFDKEGLKEFKVLTEDLDSSLEPLIHFVDSDKEIDQDEMTENPVTIEDIIAQSDISKLVTKPNEDKVVASKEFYTRVLNGEVIPEDSTQEKFKALIEKMVSNSFDRPIVV